MKQTNFFKSQSKAYGGILLNTRKGRASGRPLDTKNTMHLVLRSSKAKGDWSMRKNKNIYAIQKIVQKFSLKYGVRVLSMANVGNHLHFQIKLSNRHGYRPFIRAITSAIAMAVTGANRWTKSVANKGALKFWDYRPFTRVVQSFAGFLKLKDYLFINKIEDYGVSRATARKLLVFQSTS